MTRNDDCCTPELDRRGFVRVSLAGYLGLALGAGRSVFADEPAKSASKRAAKACIVLWLNGAPSQLELWDPKPNDKNGGPTKAIDTAVKGIQIADRLPRVAEQMQHVAVLRGMSTKEGNHQRARYYLHTGYVPSGTVQHPDMGSLICQQRQDTTNELPPYIAISGATPGPGVLGVGYSPFTVQNPLQPVANLALPAGVDDRRFKSRRELLEKLSRGFVKEHPGQETEGHTAVYDRADKLMHSARTKAFTLDDESKALREAYGTTQFGAGCLMARRLVEQGVKVVEVQLNGWDTHKDNFEKTKTLGEQLDKGFATLIKDLRDRDMLKDTLIVCMGEFGRTPKINENDGRDHYAKAWSLAMAGGPIRGGQVIGATSSDGTKVMERPVSAPELAATIFEAMGMDRAMVNHTPQGRPITVVDKDAPPIKELFA